MITLTWQRIRMAPATPFRTAKAVRTEKETLWTKLQSEGVVGWGEAVPMDTYGQTLDSAETTLKSVAKSLEGRNPRHIEDITSELVHGYDDQLATVAAIDAALHDWVGKKYGISTVEWLGLDPTRIPLTSFTIGIADRDAVAEKVRTASEFPIFKVKVGIPEGDAALSTIRATAPAKMIRVDANMGWTADQALSELPRLKEMGVEFVEQPVASNDLDGLKRLKDAAIVPIVADESCVRPCDVLRVAGRVDGINIKLSKCGGIRQGLKMIHLARAHGLKIMLGCMIESSLGISAAAQLAPLVDWLDLDGHLLLANDPFTGLGGRSGRLTIGGGPGLGVTPCN